MKTLIVYESMYGNTHRIAEQVARAFEGAGPVHVLPAETATPELVKEADLLIVGGPTHAHGLSSGQSRQGARDAVTKPGSDLNLDPDNEGAGLRDWFNSLGQFEGKHAAAFDTRIDMPAMLTGRASRGIARRLRRHGFSLVGHPESFLVDKHSHLVPGEAERASKWGEQLSRAEGRVIT